MSFKTDLWDQYRVVAKQTEDVWSLLREASMFFKKYTDLEAMHAKKIRAATEDAAHSTLAGVALPGGISVPKALRKKKTAAGEGEVEETAGAGTLSTAWLGVQRQMEEMANRHQESADNINERVGSSLNSFIKAREPEKKKLLGDGGRFTKALENALILVQTTKGKYYAAVEEQTKAAAAGDDPKSIQRQQKADERLKVTEQDYRGAIDKANVVQDEYYQTNIPDILEGLEAICRDASTAVQEAMNEFIESVSELPNALTAAFDAMREHVQSVNIEDDVTCFVDDNKTNEVAHVTIEFEEYVEGAVVDAAPRASGWRGRLGLK